MEIYLAGSRPTRRAPSEHFTGTVWQDPIIQPRRRRGSWQPASRSSRARGPIGIRIRSARRCM